MSRIERADARTAKADHRVTLDGKPFPVAIADPIAMARAIKRRGKTKPLTLADRKARLENIARQRGI
ncbi:hypothetical protein [Mesorhizobium sp. INR15]|uniref:hypothetical protein n=1 Tax=Mesorhizobium sp. INR15 TaxID=2654248 RepID=UPI0018967DC7|nr:hypothetical protein [Mesorhizobium sp. INR15]QPC90303.1 hypothetical protein GA829_06700 [Mesorhizobium sp. INR15]